jgi:hypothetical protein
MRFKNNLPFEKGFFNPVKKEVGFSNLQQLPLSSKVTELESSSHPFCTHTQSGGGIFATPHPSFCTHFCPQGDFRKFHYKS